MMKAAPKQTNNANRSAALATESSRENQSTQPSLISGRMAAQQASIASINDSPRMLAQRRRIDGYLGSGQPPISEPAPPASPIAQQPIQRLEHPDDKEEEVLQPKFASEPPAQLERQTTPKPNNTGLPDNLKSGIEALSGLSMDNVKVHYNSSHPAQLNALAYAQGTDIHVAPGQEQHLPHEAWHVVQQKQGRVPATSQFKGVGVNENTSLEREADYMGYKSLQFAANPETKTFQLAKIPATSSAPYQFAKGGLEYTESPIGNWLHRYQGMDTLVSSGTFNTAATMTIRGTQFTVFHVPNAAAVANLGALRADDITIVQDGAVKLTNDTTSPEWVIEGHNGAGLSRAQMGLEIAKLFAIRTELKNAIRGYEGLHAGDLIVFTPTGNVSAGIGLVATGLVFNYRLADVSAGAAQITMKYRNANAIKRISEVNVGKYMKGGNIVNDRQYLNRTDADIDDSYIGADYWEGDKGYYARTLRRALEAESHDLRYRPHPDAAELTGMTASQIAIVKMMIISDTMAVVMSRYNAPFGQTHNKNQQLYLAKSHRPQYIHALRNAKVSDAVLTLLRAALNHDVDTLTTTFLAAVEPKTLDINLVSQHNYPNPNGVPADFNGQADDAALKLKVLQDTATADEINQYKNRIFGNDNAFFKARLREVIKAYTDITGGQTDHEENTLLDGSAGHRGTVVSSFVYTPVDPLDEPGAVYERRDPEIQMGEGNLNAINSALDELMLAATP